MTSPLHRRSILLAAALLAAAPPSWGAVGIARVGVVGMGSPQDNQIWLAAFRAGLGALGWQEGVNLIVFDRWAEDRAERLPAMIGDLLAAGTNLLVAVGT